MITPPARMTGPGHLGSERVEEEELT